MKAGYERRLERSFREAPVFALCPDSRFVLFSDCHRGVGNSNDNFLKNQHLYFAALSYYYQKGFFYIELGDGDELWENRSRAAIREIHGNVFWMLSLLKEQGRLCLLYGNHDCEMKRDREFPHAAGAVLKPYGFLETDENGLCREVRCPEFYLTHGHQADFLNSSLWRLSRFLVRYLWKPLEQLGFLDPTSAAKNYRCRKRIEKRLSVWAVKNDCCLIAGHTHRPVLGDEKSRYFNTGSCVHPRCVTCLEMENGAISLVKWYTQVRPDSSLFVARAVLAGPLAITELSKSSAGGNEKTRKDFMAQAAET